MTHETVTNEPLLIVAGLEKHFTLHLHGARRLTVVENVGFTLHAGECLVLGGPSGAGKSSILKMVYGNYLTNGGAVMIRHGGEMLDLTEATPRQVLEVRRETLGYVSQFLRVIPRVSALDIVAEPARAAGLTVEAARARAASLLARLHLPESLWSLPPATFSGGEQQRVNIARGFAGEHRILILDEPTASLDATNRAAVVTLIEEKKASGCSFLGIFHDEDVRALVADRIVDVTGFKPVSQGQAA